MMNNYDYPEGADNSTAPWNQVNNNKIPVEVTVSVSMTKTVTVYVDDYETDLNVDEDGYKYDIYDFSETDFEKAVREQMYLPQYAGEVIIDHLVDSSLLCNVGNDLQNWQVDEFIVIKE